ncbi:hypothetical protein MO973_45065 [Paenibacillus sp. TRM 82003]|uniref:hypothetical protein n=1 Tax=Kineococcus sp. TRM81007 TaxID=2925831 RepID=UPI001F58CFC5|nr:hypothetical protein [Kineococcus sp. TRM81007]MCI2240455.1 hypothetical protein [Kineococcus sp. TRM81007]MCI3927367.1 hypothetical protein [Paenibacillus sp. TRM 82003]
MATSDELSTAPAPRRRRWHQRPFLIVLVLLFALWGAAHFYELPSALWGLPTLVGGLCLANLKRQRQREQAHRRSASSV